MSHNNDNVTLCLVSTFGKKGYIHICVVVTPCKVCQTVRSLAFNEKKVNTFLLHVKLHVPI